MHIAPPPRRKMTAEAFIAWAMQRPETEHYELDDGDIVPMAPERVLHNRVKFQLALRLGEAVRRAQLRCQVFCDGMAIEVDPTTVYEPDALVRCGPPLPDEAVKITDPIIVIEVASPSTSLVDSGAKFSGYFRIPSLHHYLLVNARRRLIVHHWRTPNGTASRTVAGDRFRLDPPGIEIEDYFPEPDAVASD